MRSDIINNTQYFYISKCGFIHEIYYEIVNNKVSRNLFTNNQKIVLIFFFNIKYNNS